MCNFDFESQASLTQTEARWRELTENFKVYVVGAGASV